MSATPFYALANYLIDNGYTDGHRVQYFQWNDDKDDPSAKFIVIQQVGGLPAEVVRSVTCTISVIAEMNGNREETAVKANDIFEALRVATVSDGAFYFQPDEPQYFFTEEQRPVFQMNVRVLAD